MADDFERYTTGLESPARRHYPIVPDDDTDLPRKPRVIYCQAAGTVAMLDRFGAMLSYDVAAGQILPFGPLRILATGTTATVYGWE